MPPYQTPRRELVEVYRLKIRASAAASRWLTINLSATVYVKTFSTFVFESFHDDEIQWNIPGLATASGGCMVSKPTFRESLVYSPFNNLTPLLAKEYFIEFNTFVYLTIVVIFGRLFFGGGDGWGYRI